MKKILLLCFISLFCRLAYAQNDNPLNDFYTSATITNSVQLDAHTYVMMVNSVDTKGSFDIVAMNDNMQVLWTTNVEGYGLGIGKFKGKIAGVAATEFSGLKGKGNTYKGFIIDATGKKLVDKIIYQDSNDYIEEPHFLIDNDYFKFALRETNVTRQIHVGIPVFFIFQMSAWSKEAAETQKMPIIDLNENLDVINTVNPVINGTFININSNKLGDIFVSCLNESDIEVYKYPAGKTAPTKELTADISIKPSNSIHLSDLILFATSKTKPNDLFYSLVYLNEDKDPEMILGKMNFEAGTKDATTVALKKADIKQLEKDFVPLNKKIDDHEIGNPKAIGLKSLIKTDDGLVVALQAGYMISGSLVAEEGFAFILNGFDDDLKLKFQQLFPVHYTYPGPKPVAGFYSAKNKFYIVSITKKSGFSALYGTLDLGTGNWDKLDLLTSKGMNGSVDGKNILWFDNTFIVPYMKFHGHGMFSPSYDILIQQNDY